MKLIHESKVKGHYHFAKKINGKDEFCFEQPSKNLILDAFLIGCNSGNYTLSALSAEGSSIANGIGASCRVGAGSTAPAASDVGLVAPLLLTSNTTVHNRIIEWDDTTGVITQTLVVRAEFAPATEAANINEVAIYTNATGTSTATQPILSRALTTDGVGTPTSVPLAIGEIFVVFYTFVCSWNGHLSFNKTIKSTPTLIEVFNFGTLADFPWGVSFRLDFNGHAIYWRTTDVPKPLLGGAFYAIAGWSARQDNVVTALTAVNPDTSGLRVKRRIGLTGAVSPTVRGLRTTINGNNESGRWAFQFTPAFEKLNSEVIDMEFFNKITRA